MDAEYTETRDCTCMAIDPKDCVCGYMKEDKEVDDEALVD